MKTWLQYIAATLIGVGGAPALPAQVPWPLPGPTGGFPTRDWDSRARMIANWYRQYLRREPDAAGLHGWIRELDRRRPDDVLSRILGSPEYFHLWGGRNDQFIRGLHVDLLGREPSHYDVRHWLRRLDDLNSHSKLAREFLRRTPGAFRY